MVEIAVVCVPVSKIARQACTGSSCPAGEIATFRTTWRSMTGTWIVGKV